MSKVKILDKSNFEKEVLQSDVPVLVDFWAPRCAPCRIMGPILDEAASEMGEKAKFAKLDIEKNPDLAEKFGISSIPYIAIFKKGVIAREFIGVMPKEIVKSALEKALNHISRAEAL